ncbi:MAG TPA: hypothetical protein VIA61_10450 [Methylomirabilota bacterium]
MVIPIVALGMVEVLVRSAVDRRPRWYGAAQQAVAEGPVDVIFVGSSRVRAAVYTPAFEQEVRATSGSCVRSLNLGRGYSTAAQHYLGLRNLFAAHPEHLPALTVFVEIPNALFGPSQWTRSWTNERQPWMLVDLLREGDLWGFWRSPGLAWAEKIHLMFRFALRDAVTTFNRRERIREELIRNGVPRILALVRRGPARAVAPSSAAGGELIGRETDVGRDPEALRAARELAREVTGAWVDRETPVHEWEASIEHDLVEMVVRQGGRVVFFRPPLSSMFARLDDSPGRQRDIRTFRQRAREWNAVVLAPHVEFTDEDFPDLWHTDHRLAETFSRALARDWLETTGPPRDAARAAGRPTSCPRP